jgi:alpha-amylase
MTCLIVFVVAVLFSIVSFVTGASVDAWRNRTIYQLLTDRFARPLSAPHPFAKCADLDDYCGGTFDGIEERLDYIVSMGFDAVWISPIVANTPGGYHGYWMKDLFAINEHFGQLSDLQRFIAAAHRRGVWVMLDVVANHVGPVGHNFSSVSPFNQSSHYHSCSGCPSGCSMNEYTCFTREIQLCRLDDLPDLNQSVPFVRAELCKFASWVTHGLAFDGLRIDTTPEVDREFWSAFVSAAGNPLALGEIFSDDVACVAAYQNVQGGALSYPLFMSLRNVFRRWPIDDAIERRV